MWKGSVIVDGNEIYRFSSKYLENFVMIYMDLRLIILDGRKWRNIWRYIYREVVFRWVVY